MISLLSLCKVSSNWGKELDFMGVYTGSHSPFLQCSEWLQTTEDPLNIMRKLLNSKLV